MNEQLQNAITLLNEQDRPFNQDESRLAVQAIEDQKGAANYWQQKYGKLYRDVSSALATKGE